MPDALTTSLNITAARTVKAAPGYVNTVIVVVAGSAAGTVNDCTAPGQAAAANQLAVIPNAVGNYPVAMPILKGLTIVPGTGQTVAVSYS